MLALKALFFTLVLLLAGCATQPAAERSAPALQPGGEAPVSWWYVRFRLRWPQGTEPLWYPDLLLADRVLGPVLDAEGDAITLWRFHRRAARDEAGRRFSFIFRAAPATAARVNARIAADPWVARLRRRGILEEVIFDDPRQPTRPGIGDTSDPSWPPEMQTAWPHFIMGASKLWLELIRELEKQGTWPSEPLARYAAIDKALNELWRSEGGHALLHHLSAIFGYQELLVTRREPMRF
jgi:hypothetical protein